MIGTPTAAMTTFLMRVKITGSQSAKPAAG
jgi:hypothetical protein